ncbi:MAG: phenylalanine--tRNA ligase subunit beta [Aquificae bacterium]|nr:phenylalanine--tRNA ligase subunit beta [Aquificota bacterium]
MRVPFSELGKFVDVSDLDPAELVEKLNAHSVEASLDFFGNPGVERVVVGKVLKTEPHPSLGKLLVCEVDVGDRKVVVCTNDKTVKGGDKVFVVLPGGRVGDLLISERNFKGITSQGMFLGLEELVGIPSEGVFKFRDPSVEPGRSVKDLLGLGEPIIELDITPNRGDLLSVKGLAREVAALYGREFREPPVSIPEPFGDGVEVEVLDPQACGRYRGAVLRGLEVKESPLWLQAALWKFGEAVINNVVDVTNYLLFLEGNPMHAFDLSKVEGKVVVRRAREGERFLALNGKEYELSPEDLVVADERKVLALAGVIGGAESAVGPDTTEVLLETAYFDPFTVRKAAKRHDVRTESSYRFERNVDVENVPRAQAMAVGLMERLAGGRLTAVVERYPRPYRPKVVRLSHRKLVDYTGAPIPPSEALRILNSLGLRTSLRPSDERGLRALVLKKVASLKGCEGFELSAEGDVDGFLLCGGKRVPVLLNREAENFEGLVVRYELTPEGLSISF